MTSVYVCCEACAALSTISIEAPKPEYRKQHCANGHPYTAENTYYYIYYGTQYRRCRICSNGWKIRHNAQKRRKRREAAQPLESLVAVSEMVA